MSEGVSPSPVETRRAALRERIVDAAAERVAEGGAEAIRARDLAAAAGCAVGALYNAVGDRNAILAAVNRRTFAGMAAEVAARVEAAGPQPVDRMVAMALAYRDYARANPRRWEALFDQALRLDAEIASGYREQLSTVVELIESEVSRLRPDMNGSDRSVLARLLYSSVHGTVALSLEGRYVAVPADHLDRMLTLLVRNVTSQM